MAMWKLTNQTPYGAERTWIRDKQGVHHWTVAVRATFDLNSDGSLSLAEEQIPPLRVAEYLGEPGRSSVRYEADLGAMKPASDVTILAQAYAPGGRPAESVLVSLRIEALQKSLRVYGDREYRGLFGRATPGRASPFVSRPIRYEDAFGGTDSTHHDPRKQTHDSRNPIGLGIVAQNGSRAPSVEYPQGSIERSGPAGFGPIASYWSPRREYAGTYDARWEQNKRPLLPDDYDERFTLSAPADQGLHRYLVGGEWMELVHMTPSGLLRLQLPAVSLSFRSRFGSHQEEHPGQLVTVVVEPDEARLSMVWQTALRVAAKQAEYLDETVIQETEALRIL